MPECECGNAPLPFSMTPSTTSTWAAPTLPAPIRRRLTVPVWLAGWYGGTSCGRTKYRDGIGNDIASPLIRVLDKTISDRTRCFCDSQATTYEAGLVPGRAEQQAKVVAREDHAHPAADVTLEQILCVDPAQSRPLPVLPAGAGDGVYRAHHAFVLQLAGNPDLETKIVRADQQNVDTGDRGNLLGVLDRARCFQHRYHQSRLVHFCNDFIGRRRGKTELRIAAGYGPVSERCKPERIHH